MLLCMREDYCIRNVLEVTGIVLSSAHALRYPWAGGASLSMYGVRGYSISVLMDWAYSYNMTPSVMSLGFTLAQRQSRVS